VQMLQGGNEYEESCILFSQLARLQIEPHYLRNKVGLELVQIDIQRTVKAKGCCDRRYDLCNEAIQVGETG